MLGYNLFAKGKTLSVSHSLASSPNGGAFMLTYSSIKTSPFGRGGIAKQ